MPGSRLIGAKDDQGPADRDQRTTPGRARRNRNPGYAAGSARSLAAHALQRTQPGDGAGVFRRRPDPWPPAGALSFLFRLCRRRRGDRLRRRVPVPAGRSRAGAQPTSVHRALRLPPRGVSAAAGRSGAGSRADGASRAGQRGEYSPGAGAPRERPPALSVWVWSATWPRNWPAVRGGTYSAPRCCPSGEHWRSAVVLRCSIPDCWARNTPPAIIAIGAPWYLNAPARSAGCSAHCR